MGNIEKRGQNSWRFEVNNGYDENGNRKKERRTIHIKDEKLLKSPRKLRSYLEKRLLEFEIEIEAGEYIRPEKTLFKEFVKEWEKKYARENLGGQTLQSYKSNLDNHILPVFGNKRLEQIKTMHIVNFLDGLQRKDGKKEPMSSSTKKYIYRVMKNILDRAVEWKLIKENPVSSVKKPKEKKKEINVYTEEEVEELFRVAQNRSLHWRVFVTLALAAGLRRGELLGLEWKHIDLEEGNLYVKQTIVRGIDNKPLIKEPKTERSTRPISLSPSIITELKAYRLHWKKEKIATGEFWTEENHEYVFCNEKGEHFYPTTPTTWWRRFIESTDVRFIRLHDLRHTSATLMINAGIHAKIISERLGHSKMQFTMDTYGHALEIADKEAAQKIDHVFAKKTAKN